MNIQTAAGYMSHGYRIRRSGWGKGEYLCDSYNNVVRAMTRVIHPRDYSFQKFDWVPRMWDIQADDWELILDGIVDDNGTVKYEDDK